MKTPAIAAVAAAALAFGRQRTRGGAVIQDIITGIIASTVTEAAGDTSSSDRLVLGTLAPYWWYGAYPPPQPLVLRAYDPYLQSCPVPWVAVPAS